MNYPCVILRVIGRDGEQLVLGMCGSASGPPVDSLRGGLGGDQGVQLASFFHLFPSPQRDFDAMMTIHLLMNSRIEPVVVVEIFSSRPTSLAFTFSQRKSSLCNCGTP